MSAVNNLGPCDCCGCFPCGLAEPVSTALPDTLYLTFSGLPELGIGYGCCETTAEGGLVNGFAYPLVRINEDQWEYHADGGFCAITITLTCASDPETGFRGLALRTFYVDGEGGFCSSQSVEAAGGENTCDPVAFTFGSFDSGCPETGCDTSGATAVLSE